MPAISGWLRFGAASLAIGASTYGVIPAHATDVVTEWSTIEMPSAPTLKPVTVDPKSTALLLLDFMTENCGQRPRCVAAVPTVKAFHDRARAASMFLAYTLPGDGKIIDDGIAPRQGEVVDQRPGGPDKFLGDDLDQRLKDHGIKTVIVCGTSAQGVGLGTGTAAAQRGYYVIYPVHCLLSESAFREAYAAWHCGRRTTRDCEVGHCNPQRYDYVRERQQIKLANILLSRCGHWRARLACRLCPARSADYVRFGSKDMMP